MNNAQSHTSCGLLKQDDALIENTINMTMMSNVWVGILTNFTEKMKIQATKCVLPDMLKRGSGHIVTMTTTAAWFAS